MAYKIDYNSEKHCVLVSVKGVFDSTVVKEIAPQVSELMAEKGCQRVLNDLREAEITKSALDIMTMSKTVEDAGIHQHFKRALVVTKENVNMQFFETTLQNRGHMMQLFTDWNAACSWLEGKS